MKSLIVLSLLVTTSAFAKIQMICNPKYDGSGKKHSIANPPEAIVATFHDNREKGTLTGSVLLQTNGKIQKLSKVELGTPDEEQISADYKVIENGKSVSYGIIFYVNGSGDSASLFPTPNGAQAGDGPSEGVVETEYTCGTLMQEK